MKNQTILVWTLDRLEVCSRLYNKGCDCGTTDGTTVASTVRWTLKDLAGCGWACWPVLGLTTFGWAWHKTWIVQMSQMNKLEETHPQLFSILNILHSQQPFSPSHNQLIDYFSHPSSVWSISVCRTKV